MFLTVVCVIVPLAYLNNNNIASKEFEEELDYVLILIRYLLPFVRLVMFIKKARAAGDDHNIEKVTFDGLDSEYQEKDELKSSFSGEEGFVPRSNSSSPLK